MARDFQSSDMAVTHILSDRQLHLLPLQDKPLCLLSLDGGGIRGLSQLLILKEIFHRLQKRVGADKPILPAEVFHMIGGTSTGGLVTILLGRLRLTIDEALECYTTISSKIFIKKKMLWQDGKFKASELERAVKEAIEEKLGKGHANDLIRFPEECQKMCKSFVCAIASNHINKVPTLFRTWESSKDPGYNCQIWEAARATSAAPRLFKQIFIGHPGRQVAYTDGALGCNNPVKYVISEASNEFGENRQIGCILSIGTGGRRTPQLDKPTGLQQLVPTRLIHVLARLATDGEEVCRTMEERFRDFPHIYQRLSAGLELGSVGIHEWERLGDIEAHTAAYLRKQEVQFQIDNIVEALMGFAAHPISSTYIRYSTPRNLSLARDGRHFFFPDLWSNEIQHLHRESMNHIDHYFYDAGLNMFREAITEMGRLCLLQKYQSNSYGSSRQFHPGVQDWAMHRHSREDYEALVSLAPDVVLHSMSEMQSTWLLEDDSEDTQNHMGSASHVLACYDNCQRMANFSIMSKTPGGHILALKFAKFFCNEGNYGIAQRMQRCILDQITPEDPLWSIAIRQLARTLFRQGEWLEAAQTQEKVVSKLVPGREDLDGAFQLTELAYMYQWPSQKVDNKEGQMARASHLASRGHAAITRLEGTNSLAAASAMIVLAEISYHTKAYTTTRDLETRAVAIRESRLGSANLSTIQARNTLAVTLAKLGEYTEAEIIHQEVRTFHLTRFGLHHPRTLEAERMLARDWRMSGKLRQARKLNEDILNRAIFSFGKRNHDTKSAANGLWRCLIAQREVYMADDLQKEYQLRLKDVEIESRHEALLVLSEIQKGLQF